MRNTLRALADVDYSALADAASDLVDYFTEALERPTGHERASLDPSGQLQDSDVLDLIEDARAAADHLYRLTEYVENLSTLI